MTAILFDYGATLDTFGQHWGMVIWHGYEYLGIPVTEAQYREAYVYGERTLGSKEIIRQTDTFLTTLKVKIDLQFDFLRDSGAWLPELAERKEKHDKEYGTYQTGSFAVAGKGNPYGACQQFLWKCGDCA